ALAGNSCGLFLAHIDLTRKLFPDRSILARHAEDEGTVERMFFPHLDGDTRPQAKGVEELDHVAVGRARNGNDRNVTRLERVQRRHVGELFTVTPRDRESVGTCRRPVEGNEEPVLDLLRKL